MNRISIALILPTIVIAVIIGIVIYFILYRRHINKTLAGRADDGAAVWSQPHHRMPSMGTAALWLCAAAVIINAVVTTVSLSKLYDRVTEISDKVNNLSVYLPLEIYSYVDDKLAEQNSLVTSAEYVTVGFDPETNRATLMFTVVPKETEANAELSLSVGGETVVLFATDGGMYSGTLEADIFREYGDVILMISDGAGQRTQILDRMYMYRLWDMFIPWVEANGGAVQGTKGKVTGNIIIAFHDPVYDSGHTLTSARMITEIDGVIADDRDVSDLIGAGGVSELPIDIDLDFGSSVSVYAVASDNMGYTYRSYPWVFRLDEDGVGVTEVPKDSGSVIITGADGSLLYDG